MRYSINDVVLDIRNKVKNKDMDLGDMNLSCIRKIVKKETVSEVVYGDGGEREREIERDRDEVAQNLGIPTHSEKQDRDRIGTK